MTMLELPHPMMISPTQAIAAIAEWYDVTTDDLDQMVAQKKPPATSMDQARIQFVFAYMCARWEEWYQSERLDL